MATVKYPFMDKMFQDKEGKNLSPSWSLFFQALYQSMSTSEALQFDTVKVNGAGPGDTITSVPLADYRTMVIFYVAHYSTNQRAGMLIATWLPDGTLPTAHFQADVLEIGNTTDLGFTFIAGSTTMRLRLDASHDYDISLMRFAL